MQFFNHYSAPILAAVLLAGGLSLVLRRGGKMRHWLILGGATVALGSAWWMFRPVATPATAAAGLPLLLQVQSPYCLGCVAIKPAVDRLERQLQGRLVLRRVDIQSAEGRRLASQYGIEFTPTFIFFDGSGQEQWRSIGDLDATRVRTSLQPSAKGADHRPPILTLPHVFERLFDPSGRKLPDDVAIRALRPHGSSFFEEASKVSRDPANMQRFLVYSPDSINGRTKPLSSRVSTSRTILRSSTASGHFRSSTCSAPCTAG